MKIAIAGTGYVDPCSASNPTAPPRKLVDSSRIEAAYQDFLG